MGEFGDETFDRHAVLECDRHRGAERVHQAADGRAFLRHGDEEFTRASVFVQADDEVTLVAGDIELVRNRVAGFLETPTHRLLNHALNHTLNHALHDALDHALNHDFTHFRRKCGRNCACGLGGERVGEKFLLLGVVGHGVGKSCNCSGVLEIFNFRGLLHLVALGRQRLAQLASVAVESVGLEAEFPAEAVAGADVFDVCIGRQVDRLRDRASDERLRCRHHADVTLGLDEALAERTAAVRAVKDREMLVLQVRRAFDRLRAANGAVDHIDLRPGESQCTKSVERHVGLGRSRVNATSGENADGHRPRAEREGDFEHGRQRILNGHQLLVRETLGKQEVAESRTRRRRRSVHRRHGDIEAERAHDIGHHFLDLFGRVAERADCRAQGLVGDLEIASARELLELHQREVGLNTRGVAVHEKTDRAGWRDDGGLSVAEAELLAVVQRVVPASNRALEHLVGVGDVDSASLDDRVVDLHGANAQVFVFTAVARSPERGASVIAHHSQHVLAVFRVASEWPVFGGEQRALRIRTASENRAEHSTNGAAFVAVVRNSGLHEHGAEVRVAEAERAVTPGEIGDFLRGERGHQHRNLKHDRPQVDRVLVAFDVESSRGRVVELEEVDRCEIARGVVKEHVLRTRVARVDAATGGAGVPRVDRAVVLHAWVGAAPGGEVDFFPEFGGLEALGDLAVGATDELPFAVGIDRVEERVGNAHRVVRVLSADGGVGLAVEVVVESQLELLSKLLLIIAENLEALDERGDLDLLAHLPVDETLDIGVIEVEANHLGSATGGAAGLDGRSGAVADLEETHQAGALAAARKRLILTAALREIRARSRAVLEQARLARPQIHDAALANKVVLHRLDEARVRLWVGVRIGRKLGRARAMVGDPMSLRGTGNSVGVVETSVEPLRAVRRRHLREQHEREFVVERLSVALRREVAKLLAPMGPATGEAVNHLLHRLLRTGDGLARVVDDRSAIGGDLRNASLAEILAHDDVGRKLAPGRGNFRVLHFEDGRTI